MLGHLIADRVKLGLTVPALTEKVKEAIKKGADLNDNSRNGHRPLQLAIKSGYIEVVRLLIENGADVNYKDRCWSTPLMVARSCCRNEIVKLLIENGARQ